MASAHVQGVLDLTFLDIKDEADLERILADRAHLFGAGSQEIALTTTTGSPTSSSRKKIPEEIKAIRLANNLIENLNILCGPLSKVLDCSKILWIDISFNHIKNVPEQFIAAFPNVTTIYCHANNISKLSVVKRFSGFPALKSLSFYGNPVEEHKHYFNYVVYYCANLRHFDMSPVTKHEKQQMEVWSRTFRKKLNPEEE